MMICGQNRHHLCFFAFGGLAILLLLFFGGFVLFLSQMEDNRAAAQAHEEEWIRQASAVIVLTGGRGRIAEAWRLAQQRGDLPLFISGVHGATDLAQMTALEGEPEELESRITLGHYARNTAENATESRDWLRQQVLPPPFILVTSSYHMPRAVLEFKMALPAQTSFFIYPVYTQGQPDIRGHGWSQRRLFLREYCKYLLVLAEYGLHRLTKTTYEKRSS